MSVVAYNGASRHVTAVCCFPAVPAKLRRTFRFDWLLSASRRLDPTKIPFTPASASTLALLVEAQPSTQDGLGCFDYRVSMAICNFYQRSTCKFGDACKNDHPGSARDRDRAGGGFGGGSNNNRFSTFNGDRYRPGQDSGSNAFGGNRDSKTPAFHLDRDDIKNDLTTQRPVYPLSCYGPGRDAPRQLIEGPVEISPEELRFKYYTLRSTGNEPAAQQEESALNEKMQSQVKAILDKISDAIKYIEEGANIHPNRIDIAKGNVAVSGSTNPASGFSGSITAPFQQASTNPFSTGAPSQPSAFGQASTPGFGKPAFGQPSISAQTTSAFGQPSNPGQTTSAFGQPSNPGQPTSAFGQPSNPGQTTSAFGQASIPGQSALPFGAASALDQKPSPFGQPSALGGAGSAFGKPAFGASGFGQPSMPGAGSAFGQASSIGQGSAFGQPSAPGAASGFGQANALGQKPNPFSKPGFGQSGFGQTAQPGASASPFGQQSQPSPSPFSQQAQQPSQPSPFGQQAQQPAQSSPFGQQASQAPKANPFGQAQASTSATPFGGVAATSTPAFGQPSKPSPFGTQPTQPAATQVANPFLKAAASAASSSPFGLQTQTQTQPQTQNIPALSQSAPQQQQQQSTSQAASTTRPHVAGTTPDGKPIDPKDRYKEGKPEEYEGEQGRLLEEIYKRVSQLGRFNDDEDIPLTPPKCEWIAPLSL
ncbi:CCCH zinc finger domain [Pyrenophora seminiperda CCB06]|uniref:CCCH zinc finger domain n=1 Tax=Pyrenophora seminiperda CCB06 TaxID=1302712 RepID=A0A3M7M7A8_9PLEO|nr:CCCH zinc finger domain [Pyrenophora seminiperda CCB06]